jgi:hypothetical protein
MRKHLCVLPLLVLLLVSLAGGIEYFTHGSQFSWVASARLWLANGQVVEGNFTVSDPWLVVLPTTQSHSMPVFWNDINGIEMQGGKSAIIHRTDGSSFKASFIYGILSGDRLYFYADEGSTTSAIYVMVFNEREKPTPEFVHIRKVEFLATPQVTDPVVFSTYR